MNKTKFETNESATGANLQNEICGEAAEIGFANRAEILELEQEINRARRRKLLTAFLKQAFFFLPGTFFLFFMSYAAGVINTEILVFGRPFSALPPDFALQFALIGAVIAVGALMTWFGLGELKNKKHFVIPASIIVAGTIAGVIIKTLAAVWDFADRMLDTPGYLIYLFPLALIVPIVAKSLVDRRDAEN